MMVIIWLACLLGIAAAQKAQCEDDAGNVHEHGDKWTDEDLSCRYYMCTDGKVRKGVTACIWKGGCYEPASNWKDGCHQYDCTRTTPFTNVVMYSVHVTAGCSHNGTCWKDGDEWENNCHTYSCKITTQEDGTQIASSGPMERDIMTGTTCGAGDAHSSGTPDLAFGFCEVGCKSDNKCWKAGDAWKKGCFSYTCVDFIDNGVRSSRIDVVPTCVHKGKCLPVGDTVDVGCNTYKCTVSDDNVRVLKLEPQSYGCRHRTDCIPEGKAVTVKCVTSRCGFKGKRLGMIPETLGCLHDGKCYQDGKEWSDPTVCATYKCTSKQRKYRITMNVRVSKHGCPWEKTCKKNNEKWFDNDCAEHVCVIRKRKFRSTHTDKMTRQLCVDNDGKCVEWGAKGFSAVVKGVKFNDCSCTKKGVRSSLTSCQ